MIKHEKIILFLVSMSLLGACGPHYTAKEVKHTQEQRAKLTVPPVGPKATQNNTAMKKTREVRSSRQASRQTSVRQSCAQQFMENTALGALVQRAMNSTAAGSDQFNDLLKFAQLGAQAYCEDQHKEHAR